MHFFSFVLRPMHCRALVRKSAAGIVEISCQSNIIDHGRIENGGKEAMNRGKNRLKSEAKQERSQGIALLGTLGALEEGKLVQVRPPDPNPTAAAVAEVEPGKELWKMMQKLRTHSVARYFVERIGLVVLVDDKVTLVGG